jgi:very-short-patch-repair endonuclease
MEAMATSQDGVVSRSQIYQWGFSRGEARANVRANRWQALGRHCIVLHTGPLTDKQRWWAAVLEAGPRAYLDGASALRASGLQNFEVARIRVSVPRGAKIRHRGSGVDIRQTRRWDPLDLVPSGVPRSRPSIAAVRAALWAVSDRQGALLLTMPVQQGLTTTEQLAEQAIRVRRDKRRRLLHDVILDLAGGIRSLNELDVVRGCRARALPEPDKQVLRRTPGGTYFLDMRWERWSVVVEVDGIQHSWAEHALGDALRHNSIALSGDVVLRLPVMGLRVCPDAFFGQIESALDRAGWRRGDVA